MLPNYYETTGVTVELGELLESGFILWDFDYPVPRSEIEYNGKTCTVDFDKERLQQKINNHYRFRQIGQETPGRFKHYLKTRMNEIMPYFVQVYELDAKFRNIDDPLESYTLTEIMDRENTSSGSAGADNVHKYSNTPQGTIDNMETHLTEATKDNSTSTSSGEGTEKYTLTRKGNIGVQPLGGEVENIRHAFINVDEEIIKNLNDLFLMVY